MKLVILESYALREGDLDWSGLAALADEVDYYPRTPYDQIAARIGDAELVIVNKCCIDGPVLDACPNLRSMFENYSSGYFKVPSVGAGTANTEFEVLTGMNLRYFGPGEYPYKTYVKEKPCESAASALSALGYGTHALHNNGGNFYSRARVFDNMGFDSFTSKEFMNILQQTPNGWATDAILVDHILDAMDTTEGKDFVFASMLTLKLKVNFRKVSDYAR